MTFKAIGQHFGFSVTRARDIYLKALRNERRKKRQDIMKQLEKIKHPDARDEFDGYMTARAVNALWRYGINTLTELRAIEPERIKRMRNIGPKTYDEIMRFRGGK